MIFDMVVNDSSGFIGRAKPQKATMEKLASFLDVSVGYFSGEPDN